MTTPSWLTHAIDQRLALLRDGLPDDLDGVASVIMTPLREPQDIDVLSDADQIRALSKWERTCDGCNTFVEDDEEFYNSHHAEQLRGLTVVIVFGVCHNCSADFKE